MNNLIKLRLKTLILKLRQILSKTVIRKAKVQHHQKNLLHPIWILNQQYNQKYNPITLQCKTLKL